MEDGELRMRTEGLKSRFKSHTKKIYYHGEVYFYWAKNRRLGSTVAGLAAVQAGFYVFNLFLIGFCGC